MRQKAEPDAVNLTPMIDIVFQMIIFFVYTIDLDREKFRYLQPNTRGGHAGRICTSLAPPPNRR